MFRVGTSVLLLCGGLFFAADATAQRSTSRGFTIGLDLGSTAIAFDTGDQNAGGNGGLRVGYGLNRIVTLYAGFYGGTLDVEDGSTSAAITLGHVDLGVRLHVANSNRRWVPFGEVALTPRFLSPDDEDGVSINGGSFTLGGGLAFYLARNWSLDFGVKWSTGEFDEVDLGNVSFQGLEIDATSARVGLGVTWWP